MASSCLLSACPGLLAMPSMKAATRLAVAHAFWCTMRLCSTSTRALPVILWWHFQISWCGAVGDRAGAARTWMYISRRPSLGSNGRPGSHRPPASLFRYHLPPHALADKLRAFCKIALDNPPVHDITYLLILSGSCTDEMLAAFLCSCRGRLASRCWRLDLERPLTSV